MNIVLFDGVCNLCNSTVLFLIKYDKNNQLHFAAQQSVYGKNLMQQTNIAGDNKSVILIKEGNVFYKSDAIIEIAKLIKGWPRIIKYTGIFPKGFRNAVYDLIANNRYQLFGKRDSCSVPSEINMKKFL
jgi:predicted DCC family thiol-disulfide oxidoreductase YuxK